MEPQTIAIRGAREHNLRNVSLDLPRNRLICLTGVSGSGKSSLAFDTVYAEGQRRYIESLSSYARQFLGQLAKPDVDQITGLSPAISIQQKSGGWNPRSTVGTVTQIADYLRVLFARCGVQHCTKCGRPITAQTREQIIGRILEFPVGTKLLVLAPVVRAQKGEFRDLFADLVRKGYTRARVDGRVVELATAPALDKNIRHDVEVVVDRLAIKPDVRSRLAEAVENAMQLGEQSLIVASLDETDSSARAVRRRAGRGDVRFSSEWACGECGLSFEPLSPQMFSFNSPTGMCPTCDGLGERFDFAPDLLVPDTSLSFLDLAIEPMRTRIGRWRRHIYEGVARMVGFDLRTPWRKLSAEARHALLYGLGNQHVMYEWRTRGGVWRHGGTFAGVVAELTEKYRKATSAFVRAYYEKYMRRMRCAECGGARLNAQASAVRFAEKTLREIGAMSIDEAQRFFAGLKLDGAQKIIAEEALKEIRARLDFLANVGLTYLSLDRAAPTLSGGESQRIRLASQIGSGLVGVLYVLDEPSIGLHSRDNRRLLNSLLRLRDMGNTVLVVEHDEETIRSADEIIDFGPGPGVRGGRVVAQGPLPEILACADSLTGKYLRGIEKIDIPAHRRLVAGAESVARRARKSLRARARTRPAGPVHAAESAPLNWLTVRGARHNNLQRVDASLPLGRFTCVTGVSGSGKSSLVNDILAEALARDLNGAETNQPGAHDGIDGLEHLDKVIVIDQSPIGRTPRSNPATYIKLFDEIRNLFAMLPDAKVRGYKSGRFSFNVPTGARGGGRCEACEGYGATKMEMDFLADIWVQCPVCEGRRFNRETLQITFKHKSIADVLDMDVQEALEHFANVPKIERMVRTLHDVGLDYIKLGQSSTTLSGGEAQRIKLARELVRRATGRTIYLLDEPTTGLHFHDIRKLLEVLHGFVDAGNTVVVIEHNLDVIKTADWIIDLGPEGGAGGGRIIAAGTPEQVAAHAGSFTGQALAPLLNGRVAAAAPRHPAKRKPAAARAATKTNGAINAITVVGARQHNLKNITIEVPRGKTTVCSGPSGSGKSSFALDTVYAEGQRRYVESLSAYARQFLGQLAKPRVDHVYGLSPAISIEQKSASKSPRSTVGTVTEIHDYLRVLWARLGEPYCPKCNLPIGAQTSDQIVERILELPEESALLLLAPIERTGSETWAQLFARQRANGYVRVRIDGQVRGLDQEIDIDHRRRHAAELVIDRIVLRSGQRSRITDSVEQALSLGAGVMVVHVAAEDGGGRDLRFSQLRSCNQCGTSYEELTPHHFSFNARMGWCPVCEGLGTQLGAAIQAIVAHPGRTLRDGAIDFGAPLATRSMLAAMLGAVLKSLGADLDTPWFKLSPEQQSAILQGTGPRWIDGGTAHPGLRFQWKGFFPAIDEATKANWQHRQRLEHVATEVTCQSCHGSRLRADAAAVRLSGRTMLDVCSMPLAEALQFFETLRLDQRGKAVAGEVLHEVRARLRFLVDVGLDYLTLARTSPSLSGGEAQRIRLASQIGSGLTGVLYVMDEPTIGLHPRDNRRLITALDRLRNLGNTLLIVEHDRDVIASAQHVLDFGPGAGSGGGTITATGTPQAIQRKRASLTGAYLSGSKAVPVPTNRRAVQFNGRAANGRRRKQKSGDGQCLSVRGACEHNLRNIDVRFPLGRFTVVTGVSGSGKSTLVSGILYPALARRVHRARLNPGAHESVDGVELIDKVINVDQEPIGNSPTSNPATYCGVFDDIRELFARLPDSRVRGYTAKRFSFNRSGGRCEPCEGNGQKCVQMHFLPDVWIECEECRGARYNRETLEVRFRSRNISDVLNMSVAEAIELFESVPRIRRRLETLADVGLGYISLGQAAPTLSGGEAQRVKLAAELGRPSTGRTVYILDEPTTGLHFDDLRKLLDVLHRLVDLGNTVICIEHNLDVIKTADWVIDLGPEAGARGGDVVVAGPPEAVAAHNGSHTGAALRELLAAGPHVERPVYDPAAHAQQMLEQAAPLKLAKEDAQTQMPWQRDGLHWHTRDRVDHGGKKIRWSGALLVEVCGLIQEAGEGRFRPTDWNDRARVEITAPGTETPWFFHALTGNQWHVALLFRVPRGTFSLGGLISSLKIPTFDERDDLPVYGRWQRVRLRRRMYGLDEVQLYLHDARDIRPAALRAFIRKAVAGYLKKLDSAPPDAVTRQPWTRDGRAWHLAQKGLTPRGRKSWTPQTLIDLTGRLNKAVPRLRLDWNHKSQIRLLLPEIEEPLGRLVTYSRQGIKVELQCKRGALTPARIEGLGDAAELRTGAGETATLRFVVHDDAPLDNQRLAAVVRECAASMARRNGD